MGGFSHEKAEKKRYTSLHVAHRKSISLSLVVVVRRRTKKTTPPTTATITVVVVDLHNNKRLELSSKESGHATFLRLLYTQLQSKAN